MPEPDTGTQREQRAKLEFLGSLVKWMGIPVIALVWTGLNWYMFGHYVLKQEFEVYKVGQDTKLLEHERLYLNRETFDFKYQVLLEKISDLSKAAEKIDKRLDVLQAGQQRAVQELIQGIKARP